jgi:hypothetical protein
MILVRHLLNQRDSFRVQFGTPTAITRFEFPEQSKTLAMPAQERVGFEDEEHISPILHATGEKDEPEAIGLRQRGLLDFTAKDDELLTEQRIFGDEIGFSACQVGGHAENYRMAGRLGKMQEGRFQERDESDNRLSEQMKEGEHVVGLQESYQKLSDDCIQRSNGVKSRTDGVFGSVPVTGESLIHSC